jgi:hypothetical protein
MARSESRIIILAHADVLLQAAVLDWSSNAESCFSRAGYRRFHWKPQHDARWTVVLSATVQESEEEYLPAFNGNERQPIVRWGLIYGPRDWRFPPENLVELFPQALSLLQSIQVLFSWSTSLRHTYLMHPRLPMERRAFRRALAQESGSNRVFPTEPGIGTKPTTVIDHREHWIFNMRLAWRLWSRTAKT